MERRDFLKYMGLGLVAATAPKFIFDMGANLYKPKLRLYRTEFPGTMYIPLQFTDKPLITDCVIENYHPRYGHSRCIVKDLTLVRIEYRV